VRWAVRLTATFLARLTLVVVPRVPPLLLAALLQRPVMRLRRFPPRAAAKYLRGIEDIHGNACATGSGRPGAAPVSMPGRS
jgi:hypothetical protein